MIDNPFDLGIHLAREHIKHHFVIGDKRPERILKSRGFIFFDKEMRKPGEGVADHETERNIEICPVFQKPDKQNESERRADKMQVSRQRLAVFKHIKIPKFRVSLYFFSHI